MKPSQRIFLALDNPDFDYCYNLTKPIQKEIAGVKIGLEFFTANGPEAVKKFVELDLEVFLDLKFHDIPNTVRKSVRQACNLGIKFLTVHAAGGAEMLSAAQEEVELYAKENNVTPPTILAVTVLTSMSEQDLSSLGIENDLEAQIVQLAKIAQISGIKGIVCSALEVPLIKNKVSNDLIVVTPGIRFSDEINKNIVQDQKRVVSPNEAIKLGSDYLVMGRSLAKDPVNMLKKINGE